MSRSGLMTLDPVVSLRSGRAAEARTGIRSSHADPPNSTTWPSSPGGALSNSYGESTLRQSILRCAQLARADAQS
jgi:hypothetical protein